jgi:drug/metabolite transporter (DMT)-like permease
MNQLQEVYISKIRRAFFAGNRIWVARVALIIGVVIVSGAGLFIKLGESEITPFAVAFNRLWIAALAFLAWNIVDSRTPSEQSAKQPLTYSIIILLVIAGIIRSVVLILWGYSLFYTSVTNFTLLHNLEPLFIPLIAGIFTEQQFDRIFWIGWLIAVVGLTGILLEDLTLNSESFLGDFIAFSAAFLTTFYYLIKEKLINYFSVTSLLNWVCLIGALILFPVTITTSERIFPYSISGWVAVVSLALLCQFIGHGLITYSLNKLSSALVTLFLPLETIFATIWSNLVLSEKLNILNYLSCLVVLVGVSIATSSSSSVKLEQDEQIE